MKKSQWLCGSLLAVTLAACKPETQVTSVDRVYRVDEFNQNASLRQGVLAACDANPGQLHDDPNCVNAMASRTRAAGVEDPHRDGNRYEAQRTVATQDIAIIMLALSLYRLDNGVYPTKAQGLKALVEKPTLEPVPGHWRDGGYLARLPSDPFGHPYQYLNPGPHGEIDVVSLGADGQPNGEGAGADIGSWDPAVSAEEKRTLRSGAEGRSR